MMKWNYQGEEIQLEDWIWEATYEDGTLLRQFDSNGVFHKFNEIEQSRVAQWTLKHVQTGGTINILVPEGSKLIHMYKRFRYDHGGPNERRGTVYVFGYQKKGQTPHYNYILPDGRVYQTTEHVEVGNFGL